MAEMMLLVKATIVLTAALTTVAIVRRSAAAVRALILTVAFAVLLAMPFAQWVIPARPIPLRLPAAQSATVPTAPMAQEVPPPAAGRGQSRAAARPVARLTPALIVAGARIIWFTGGLWFAFRLATALRRLVVLRRRGQPWRHEAAEIILRRATSRRVDIFLHPGLSTPMTCGIIRPAVGLPVDAPDWPADDLRQALIHEAEHIRRGDWLVQLLAKVTCALYWFHPLAWRAVRRLQLEIEHACDDAVVRTSERTAYAQQLLTMARSLGERASMSALGMADRCDLAKRVDAVLNPLRARGNVRRSTVALTVGAAALLAAALAPWQPVSAQASAGVEDVRPIPTSLTGKRFESVAIRPGDSHGSFAASFDSRSGRLSARNVTLHWLISQAFAPTATLDFMPQEPYQLHDTHIKGAPDWDDTFVIEATAPLPATAADLREMLRQLLHDSFDLFVRVEREETAAYRIVRARVDGGLGPGLRQADQSCADRFNMEGGGAGRMVRRCITLAALAADVTLEEVLGRPAIDGSGVTGLFDLSLTYAPTREELATIYETSVEQMPREVMARPSIFTAFEQQLGLKLEPTRGAIHRLIVDHAARPLLTR